MRTPLTRLLIIAAATLGLAACGGNETTTDPSPTPAASSSADASSEPSPGDTGSASSAPAAPQGTVVDITVKGDSVDPNGERVKAELGKPVTLVIDSDREGELHVHSTPEQEIAFQKGRTETQLTIDQPGVVEVEDHESGKVIVQLQVS